jgi:hypothetical protein
VAQAIVIALSTALTSSHFALGQLQLAKGRASRTFGPANPPAAFTQQVKVIELISDDR